ncbi:MAG: hypothetical protein HY800_07505 [Ignavibacteriales bacterium]|nr:hypothetical protein [Ignavibacteriales bacterium]
MNKGKQVKTKLPIEYRLRIGSKIKDYGNKIFTQFILQTINEFTNFRYEIIVEPVFKNHTLLLNIRGLRTPNVTIPGLGPAVFQTEYENLSGIYEIVISKHGKEENKFSIKIDNNKITVKRSPTRKFVEIVTDSSILSK